jgi:hypothetical protein
VERVANVAAKGSPEKKGSHGVHRGFLAVGISIVLPGHTGTATALSAGMSKLQTQAWGFNPGNYPIQRTLWVKSRESITSTSTITSMTKEGLAMLLDQREEMI